MYHERVGAAFEFLDSAFDTISDTVTTDDPRDVYPIEDGATCGPVSHNERWDIRRSSEMIYDSVDGAVVHTMVNTTLKTIRDTNNRGYDRAVGGVSYICAP